MSEAKSGVPPRGEFAPQVPDAPLVRRRLAVAGEGGHGLRPGRHFGPSRPVAHLATCRQRWDEAIGTSVPRMGRARRASLEYVDHVAQKKRIGRKLMTETNGSSITRRGVIASATAGAGAAALGGTPAPAQTSAPKTFVLVHGAWHGGWCCGGGSVRYGMKGHE